jgi:2-iminobutanoate/2-iminopropanoate deaminase
MKLQPVQLLTGLVFGALLATLSASQPAARRYINRPNRAIEAPFSDAVLVGNTLYVAGSIGLDPKTGAPPTDLDEEIRLLLGGMRETLQAAGMTLDQVVSVQVFCPDLTLYDRFNKAYRSYFGANFPARAFIGSGPLLRGGHFEATAVAVKE